MRSGMAGGENVASFDEIFSSVHGNVQHNAYDADVANSFYNLATDFYEYGWGDSFHFGFRKEGEPHGRAIQNTQNFVATKVPSRVLPCALIALLVPSHSFFLLPSHFFFSFCCSSIDFTFLCLCNHRRIALVIAVCAVDWVRAS